MTLEEKTLYPKKYKTFLWLLLCLVFTVGGVFMINDESPLGWLVSAFFGLGVIVFSISLLPNAAYLKLDNEGFEACTMFKKNKYRWQDVGFFTVGKIHANKMVMFNYSQKNQNHKTIRKINVTIAGSEAALPDTYGLKAKDLAHLMNEYKHKYSTN